MSRSLPVAYLFLGALGLFCLLPFAWVFLASIDGRAGVRLSLPDAASLSNYLRFFADPNSLRYVANSMVLAGGATLLVIVSAVLAGYALSRFSFPGRRPLMYGVLMSRIIPPTATIIPLFVIVQRMGLSNTHLGLILVLAAQQLPLAIWLLKGFFDTVPSEIEEAAWIDGADRLGSAFRIVLPLAAPGVGAAALFAFIEAWGDFLTPFILAQSPDLYPLSIGLYKAYAGHNIVDWGLLTATSVIYMLPTLVLYLAVRRYLMKATVVGAISGQ